MAVWVFVICHAARTHVCVLRQMYVLQRLQRQLAMGRGRLWTAKSLHLQANVNDDTDGVYEEVDGMYDEELLEILDSVDVHVPIAAPTRPEPDTTSSKPVDKKASKAEREAEKAKAEADRAKEREKANIAAMRAQLAAKGCAPADCTTDDVAECLLVC